MYPRPMELRLRNGRRVVKGARIAIPLVALGLLAAGIAATPSQKTVTPPAKKKIDFNRDVRPILDKCLSCHGHDSGARRAGLRLDMHASATSVLADGKRAIVPGYPEQSELIARVDSTDKYSLMPPPSSNRILSAEDRATLTEWILEGAEYKQHWAFVKPVRPPLPKVAFKSWPYNSI